MSLLFVIALMMAQATAAQPAQVPAQAQVAKKVKPAQVCEYIEVTGSRSKRRVCHDATDNADLSGYGVSNSAFGKTKVNQPDVQTGGPGSN